MGSGRADGRQGYQKRLRPDSVSTRPGPYHRLTCCLSLCGLLCAGALQGSAPLRETSGSPPETPAEAERITEHVYRLGQVTIDLKAGSVSCQGRLNKQRGFIEYLAVARRGKRHETVLEVDVRPLHLQLGLIMLGLEPQGGLRFQGDANLPKGPPVDVWVAWERGGTEVRFRGERLVWNVEKKREMEEKPWIFSGSLIDGRGFAADREKSLIATYRDPVALVNNRLPAGADDTSYEANPRVCPRVGTRVELLIQKATPPDG